MIFVCYVTDYSVIYASLCHKYGQIYIILLLKFATHVHDNMFCDLIIRFSLATKTLLFCRYTYIGRQNIMVLKDQYTLYHPRMLIIQCN